MQRRRIVTLGLGASLAIIGACDSGTEPKAAGDAAADASPDGKKPDAGDAGKLLGSVQGLTYDVDTGRGAGEIRVRVEDADGLTMTRATGEFELPRQSDRDGIVVVELDDGPTMRRRVPAGDSYVTLPVKRYDIVQRIDVDRASLVEARSRFDGEEIATTTVRIPKNSVTDGDRPRIGVAVVNPADGRSRVVPMDGLAQIDGKPARMVPVAVADVSAFDERGERLPLRDGAELSILLPARSTERPPEMGVWAFDPVSNRWEQEGTAILTADREGRPAYRLKATHLSWWAVGEINSELGCARVCTRNANGPATVHGDGGGITSAAVVDEEGCAIVEGPRDELMTVRAYAPGQSSGVQEVLAGGNANNTSSCSAGPTLNLQDSDVSADSCAPGTQLCDGHCIERDTDPEHCGACNQACGTGFTCFFSTCVCSGTRCSGYCAPDAWDSLHCGGVCGESCGAAEFCNEDQCEAIGCGGGTTACGDACVFTDEDTNHCGGCDLACASDEACEAGSCVPNGAGMIVLGDIVTPPGGDVDAGVPMDAGEPDGMMMAETCATNPMLDGDMDGVNCTLDCADDDNLRFPGNTETAGDLFDSDCDGLDDPAAVCDGSGAGTGRDWIVAVDGVDPVDCQGGCQAAPFASLAKAQTCAGALDVLRVGGGTYLAATVPATISNAVVGSYDTTTWKQDVSGSRTILEANAGITAPVSDLDMIGATISGAGVAVTNVNFTVNPGTLATIVTIGSGVVTIDGCTTDQRAFTGTRTGIDVQGGTVMIRDSQLLMRADTDATIGLRVGGGSDVTVENSTIQGAWGARNFNTIVQPSLKITAGSNLFGSHVGIQNRGSLSIDRSTVDAGAETADTAPGFGGRPITIHVDVALDTELVVTRSTLLGGADVATNNNGGHVGWFEAPPTGHSITITNSVVIGEDDQISSARVFFFAAGNDATTVMMANNLFQNPNAMGLAGSATLVNNIFDIGGTLLVTKTDPQDAVFRNNLFTGTPAVWTTSQGAGSGLHNNDCTTFPICSEAAGNVVGPTSIDGSFNIQGGGNEENAGFDPTSYGFTAGQLSPDFFGTPRPQGSWDIGPDER